MKKTPFPYLALDIETTGIDRENSHVLSLAAIYDDTINLHIFNETVYWDSIKYGEPYALQLNSHLLGKGSILANVRSDFNKFLEYALKFENGRIKLTLAGKNVAGFDLPILTNYVNNFSISHYFNHRILDVGSLYAIEFDHIPSLEEIAKKYNLGEQTHTALEDCELVVKAIRRLYE